KEIARSVTGRGCASFGLHRLRALRFGQKSRRFGLPRSFSVKRPVSFPFLLYKIALRDHFIPLSSGQTPPNFIPHPAKSVVLALHQIDSDFTPKSVEYKVRARRLRCITGLSSAAGAALGRSIAGDRSAHRQQGLQQ